VKRQKVRDRTFAITPAFVQKADPSLRPAPAKLRREIPFDRLEAKALASG